MDGRTLLIAAVLPACNPYKSLAWSDEDCAEAAEWFHDGDGDGHGDPSATTLSCVQPAGFVSKGTDCDDSNAAIRPGASEVCDLVDNDCNGWVDDADPGVDPTTFHTIWTDGDGDGFGNAHEQGEACGETPVGWAARSGDCDDTTADVHPDARELCNTVDDNCDGVVDPSSSIDAPTWYLDDDGDGFGDLDAPRVACLAPADHVSNHDDCDDRSATVHPHALEVCNGIDDDCDGDTDDSDSSLDASTASEWYRDHDTDGYGDASSTTRACLQPSGFVPNALDCDDSTTERSPDSQEVCNAIDDDCDDLIDDDDPSTDLSTGQAAYADLDADGYGDPALPGQFCDVPVGWSVLDTDCDDSNALVSPSAREVCNELDDDCDGDIDDDDTSLWGTSGTLFYIDADADGYGTTSASVWACLQPSGAVADNTDCDDTDATIHPGAADAWYDGIDANCDGASDYDADGDGVDSDGWGGLDCDDTDSAVNPSATEVCNSVDDDCDAATDDDDPGLDLTTATTWYADLDGDGFGDATNATTTCVQPSNAVLDDTDCDDTRALSHPGAADTWYDGYDDDCDGASDYDADGDGYTHDGYAVGSANDCDDSDASKNPGATAWCDDCNSSTYCTHSVVSSADATLVGEAYRDQAGTAVCGGGDVDGDGRADLLIAAPGEDSAGADAGAVYLWTGVLSGSASLSASTAKIEGAAAGDDLGDLALGLAMPGDLDADGFDDFLIGVPTDDTMGTDAGGVALFLGPVTGTHSVSDADAWWLGSNTSSRAGSSIRRAGDVDLDGTADFWACDASNGGAFLVAGPASAGGSLSAASLSVDTCVVGDAGDVDGDGHTDLIVGDANDSTGGTGAGAAFVFYGPHTGTMSTASADVILIGETTSRGASTAGSSVAGPGDLDGDGLDDLAVGAPWMYLTGKGYYTGVAYVVYGTPSATAYLASADVRLEGEDGGDICGRGLEAAGDVDGDGRADLLVTAYGLDTGGANAGGVAIVTGGLSGTYDLLDAGTILLGWNSASGGNPMFAGHGASPAGDIDADGLSDVIVGAPRYRYPDYEMGSVTLVLGSSLP